jgi:hypothetical protein
MPSQSETGHAKNVANFQSLISFCSSYGSNYNPSKEALKISNLQTKLAQAQAALQQVKITQTAFNNATNSRVLAFKPLKPLATKIVNALDATDATTETVKDARTINRKIQGVRATPKPKDSSPAEEAEQPSEKTISSSQLSYDLQIEHFEKLIQLLISDSNYKPNEADLTIDANHAKLDELKTANTAVIDTYTNFSNSRISRNNVLYNILTGLVNTALDVKKYVKSIYGATDPQYKQVNKLEFKTRKD